MTETLLDSRMKIDKIKEQYKIENIKSVIVDVSDLDSTNFIGVLETYVDRLEKA